MNNYRNIHSSRGFTLIEALVALIVLAVGLLSLAQFHTNLVSSGALTKTRTEAINVAQEKLEELRNNIEVTDYTGLVSSTSGTQETVNGTNAIYTVSWTVGNVPNSLQAKVITVSASWTGRDGTTQTISLVSNIAWNNPVTSVALAGAGVANPLIETPKGSAEFVYDRTYTDDQGNPSLPQSATDNDDGTQTYQDGDTYELIDEATGDVILELDCANNTCAGFVTISGTVVIDDGDVTATDVNVMASDVAFCARSIDDTTATDVVVYPTGATGNNIDYTAFTYTCYLGHGWYGNIGILRTDNANSNERVCLGDPTVASNDTYYPTVNNNRTYRGLFNLSTDNGTPPIYYSFGADAGTTITGHDFFLDTITGNNVTGADCITPMTNDYEGNADGTGTGTNIFAGVPDNFYCLNPHITTPTGPGSRYFAKVCFGHPSPSKQQNFTRPFMPAAPDRPAYVA
ncbi:type IV pilus modification PilV family protein [Candidatus Reidiella endopervernicosa]|uniref:Prepilin-type N-terminal cleavage/methylation domain-containing protein n=1 Tax=Candidatus Reidiella endopervernicosa TaxID=2738883 RepID=A0A6N0HZB9_9GAMM|nr:prepilin-type N-terminal cleavage/methylation domain-containing protein [Candidatus Reidiella endopervernicosa]QKQ27713.1 prepilin-type N-terminal cleavage/methylation domain-containing protein [Candidatus Reidiella endopervernicosa]